jgi:flagellar biosynthesis protein
MNNNESKRVVGLGYMPETGVPTVIVKGAGPVADELIKSTLHTKGPRLVRDKALLEQLYRLPIDATIDPALFQVVAVVLSHVFAVNEKMKGNSHV